MYSVTLIPGDGVGPEIAEATRKCIDATGVKINWDVQDCGIEVIEKVGKVPERVLDSIKKNTVALKAPITTPIGKGFRSVNVYLRQALNLYACVRPCKSYPGVRGHYQNVNLVVVRENTEDLYAGVEFEAGQPKTAELITFINNIATGKKISTGAKTTGVSIKPMSVEGTRNITNYAFDYAIRNNRKSVCSVCKANIMKFTDGLWYKESRAVALAYGAKFEDKSLAEGVAPDSELAGKVKNTGGEGAIFEATHGSAPKYKGQNKVNPTALILSGKLMLEHLGEKQAADKLERAVAAVIAEGKDVTYDMKADRNDPTAVGTQQMAEAICRKMRA